MAPELARYFRDAHVEGSIALYDTSEQRVVCSDGPRCKAAYLPASTFKIANSLIGLENGAISSADSVLPWDGQNHAVADWNQDHTLRTGFQASCVPCFQQVARLVGESSMQSWLKRLDYGNTDMTGGLDVFWLKGGLRITPLEQLDFLWRLDAGLLEVRPTSRAIVLDIMELEHGPEYILRGKTGLALPPDSDRDVGWFVGWVERRERRVYFATVIDGHPPEVDLVTTRRALTERILRDRKLLP